jgi:hypothetical protein
LRIRVQFVSSHWKQHENVLLIPTGISIPVPTFFISEYSCV